MYNPSGPSCMRWNVRGFLKINFIGVSSWQRSVSGEHRLCRATLHRHLGGRAHSRLTRDSLEVGIVPERMPSDVCDSDLHRSRTDKTPHESLSPIRVFPERSGTSKYPVIWFLVRCVLPPCPQRFRQVSIERNWFLRSLGLARSNYLKHDRPCDTDLVCLE